MFTKKHNRISTCSALNRPCLHSAAVVNQCREMTKARRLTVQILTITSQNLISSFLHTQARSLCKYYIEFPPSSQPPSRLCLHSAAVVRPFVKRLSTTTDGKGTYNLASRSDIFLPLYLGDLSIWSRRLKFSILGSVGCRLLIWAVSFSCRSYRRGLVRITDSSHS